MVLNKLWPPMSQNFDPLDLIGQILGSLPHVFVRPCPGLQRNVDLDSTPYSFSWCKKQCTNSLVNRAEIVVENNHVFTFVESLVNRCKGGMLYKTEQQSHHKIHAFTAIKPCNMTSMLNAPKPSTDSIEGRFHVGDCLKNVRQTFASAFCFQRATEKFHVASTASSICCAIVLMMNRRNTSLAQTNVGFNTD